jgi:hypothetical protein
MAHWRKIVGLLFLAWAVFSGAFVLSAFGQARRTQAQFVAGPTVIYPAGWNLVAAPAGTVLPQATNTSPGVVGMLFTFTPYTYPSYASFPANTPLQPNVAYWAFFSGATAVTIPTTVPPMTIPATTAEGVPVQLKPNQFAMIGNQFSVPVALTGAANEVFTYNATTGAYQNALSNGVAALGVGQGAIVFSTTGGTLFITAEFTAPPTAVATAVTTATATATP